jgi:hypothetical protein
MEEIMRIIQKRYLVTVILLGVFCLAAVAAEVRISHQEFTQGRQAK